MNEKKALTSKQKAFVEHYMVTENAYKSALLAGYSEKFAKGKSYTLLDNPAIAGQIERRQRELLRKVVNPEKILAVLATIATADPLDYVEVEDGILAPKNTRDIPRTKRMAIGGIRQAGDVVEYRFPSPSERTRAAVEIARLTGAFEQPPDIEAEPDEQNPFGGFTTEELRELIRKHGGSE